MVKIKRNSEAGTYEVFRGRAVVAIIRNMGDEWRTVDCHTREATFHTTLRRAKERAQFTYDH